MMMRPTLLYSAENWIVQQKTVKSVLVYRLKIKYPKGYGMTLEEGIWRRDTTGRLGSSLVSRI